MYLCHCWFDDDDDSTDFARGESITNVRAPDITTVQL